MFGPLKSSKELLILHKNFGHMKNIKLYILLHSSLLQNFTHNNSVSYFGTRQDRLRDKLREPLKMHLKDYTLVNRWLLISVQYIM